MDSVVDTIVDLFRTAGRSAYFGEPVSQEEHALQCAHLAERHGAADALVVAALLHDVGHLLHEQGEDIAERGTDAQHEQVGYDWLMERFGPTVAEPVRLHVAAKRFLCATDAKYFGQLSPASRISLALQGGSMTPAEAAKFSAHPAHLAAVNLRRWDDEAKVPGLAVPELNHYRGRIAAAAIS
jgi:phosphonate degradation associated HDIG domain protein